EARLLGARVDLSADLLKVGHHGSATSTNPEFLRTIGPKIAVVSVGKRNRYGHPSPRVLQRLAENGVQTWRTDVSGAILAETDGARWFVHGYRKQNGPAKAGP
ncbi:MAG: ComEC/Rec2 family competence protein, partial [Armatimonadota bacterium]